MSKELIAVSCSHGATVYDLMEQLPYFGVNHVTLLTTLLELIKEGRIGFIGDVLWSRK